MSDTQLWSTPLKAHGWDATSSAPRSLVLLMTQNQNADFIPSLHRFHQDHSAEPFAVLPAIPSPPWSGSAWLSLFMAELFKHRPCQPPYLQLVTGTTVSTVAGPSPWLAMNPTLFSLWAYSPVTLQFRSFILCTSVPYRCPLPSLSGALLLGLTHKPSFISILSLKPHWSFRAQFNSMFDTESHAVSWPL